MQMPKKKVNKTASKKPAAKKAPAVKKTQAHPPHHTLAIKDDDLERKLDVLTKEISILREVAGFTKKDFDIGSIFERFLDIVMEVTDSEAGSLLMMDDDVNTLSFVAARGEKSDKLFNYKICLGEGIAGWVAQAGKPVITPDAEKDKRFAPKISNEIKYKTRNMLCVPIKFEDEVLGVIEMLNKKSGNAYDEQDLVTLESYAPYISVIIKNAKLFIENKKRIDRLEHLMEMTKFVNSTLNLDTLLDMLLEMSTHTLNAEAGSLLLLDDEKNELVFRAATGTKKEEIKDMRLPVGEGIAGWVAREDQPLLVADAQHDPRFFSKADEKTDFITKTIIAVPLKTKDKLIGVVEVLNKKHDELFTNEDLMMLQALANGAAVAIENAKLYEGLRQLFLDTVKALADAIETKDLYTRGHSERVTMYSVMIGKALKLPNDELENLRLAALLHDIGKIGISEAILRKPGKLTDAEFAEIKRHPDYAVKMIGGIKQMKAISNVVLHHHERFDGNGYPAGLKSEAIPYNARIIAVADSFDAMASDRPYRKALPFEMCVEEIKRCAGTQFDPEIAKAAVGAFEDFNSLKTKKN